MYVIKQTRHYYNSPDQKSLVRESGRALQFNDRAEAQNYIRGCESGTYYQSHNEYGRPDYKILRISSLPQYLQFDL